MTVGFTGTRSGMSKKQATEVIEFLKAHDAITVAQHGVCIGADIDFHAICRAINPSIFIVGHPGKGMYDKPGIRPNRGSVVLDQEEPEDTHFSRNRKIVDTSDILLACPYNDNGEGGTWYTINYAKKVGKTVIIFER